MRGDAQITVLGIPVPQEQLGRWLKHYCPPRQPFRTRDLPGDVVAALPRTRSLPLTNELRDTFFMYGGGPWVWLSEEEYADLSPGVRSVLAGERRGRIHPKPAPAWPSDPMIEPRLVRWIETGTRPSLHALAQEHLQRASEGLLPRASELAGTSPGRSGPNCFATVMAAAGDPVHQDWVQTDQFQAWLDRRTRTSGSDDVGETAGQVLVWHQDGELAHAAVTVGGGWVLQKPSQSWSSPVVVWTVEEAVRSWLLRGARLTRHTVR